MIQEGVFQIYATHEGKYAWWLLDEVGALIAQAPKHYENLGDCIAGIEQVKRLAGRARLEELPVSQSGGSEEKTSTT